MTSIRSNELYSEKLFHKLIDSASHYRFVIAGSFLVGILSYIYLFTNNLPNHDVLAWFFEKGASIESGRFGLALLSHVFPDYSLPWVYGILGLFFYTLGNCMIIRIFHIRNHILQFLLGGIIISFPALIGTFTYSFTSCPYAVCYFFSVLAAACIVSGKLRYLIPAILAMVASISIYQAYLSITVSILILFLLYQLILDLAPVKVLFYRGILYVIFLFVSLAAYWGISSLFWTFSENTIGAYASNALTFGIASILSGIKNAYIGCIRVMCYRHYGLIASRLSHIIHLALCAFAAFELLWYVFRERNIQKTVFLLFLVIILPLGINCIYIFVAVESIHTLVLFSYIALYILFIILIEYGQIQTICSQLLHILHKLLLELTTVAMAIIIAGNIFLANEAFLNMQLAYENTYSFATSVVTQLRNMPEYTPDSKVTIVGEYHKPDFYQKFTQAQQITGAAGISPSTYSIQFFYEFFIGQPLNLVSLDSCAEIIDQDQLHDMPAYPQYGYIAQNNGIFTIKLSDIF